MSDEPEIVSYLDHGRLVIESKQRVAALSRYGSELFHLYNKTRHASSTQPLAGWDFADLIPTKKGTTSEAQATKWVIDGVWK